MSRLGDRLLAGEFGPLTDVDRMCLPNTSEELMLVRRTLLEEGVPVDCLRLTPIDLARFGLEPWPERLFGMVCVESPIVAARWPV